MKIGSHSRQCILTVYFPVEKNSDSIFTTVATKPGTTLNILLILDIIG